MRMKDSKNIALLVLPGPERHRHRDLRVMVRDVEIARLGLVLEIRPEQFQQLIVGGMRRRQPDLELVRDRGETRVRVVNDEAPDLDFGAAAPDAEDGPAVDELPDVD